MSETLVKPLSVLCSTVTPYLFIVQQELIFRAKNKPQKIPPDLQSIILRNSFIPTNPAFSNLSHCLLSMYRESVSVY